MRDVRKVIIKIQLTKKRLHSEITHVQSKCEDGGMKKRMGNMCVNK